jgi:hypothetical protein
MVGALTPLACCDRTGSRAPRHRRRDRPGKTGTDTERTLMIETACLQCGTPAGSSLGTFCRRCGLPFGERPRGDVELPACPICYRTVDDDGRLASLDHFGLRVDLVRHRAEHDRHPVGDDDWLETLREGDRIRIGRWFASFDVVRRYLVTGQVEAGRGRALAHDAIVNAMTQISRWGPNGIIFGDQPELAAARAEVSNLMERYARGRR